MTEVELGSITEVRIDGEWIEVRDGSFSITTLHYTRNGYPYYADPDTGYRFRTHTDRVIVGPLTSIHGYRCHQPE